VASLPPTARHARRSRLTPDTLPLEAGTDPAGDAIAHAIDLSPDVRAWSTLDASRRAANVLRGRARQIA
jgi:hypothetical protein